ncbi:unnamed protein product, partial [Sphacelaria rigidula]
MKDHRGQGEFVAADITTGPHRHFDGEHWGQFPLELDQAAFQCTVARIVGEGGDIDTCLQLELRQAIPTMKREPQVFRYLLIQLGTTKSWSDSKAVIDRLADKRRVDERGAAATCMVAADE